MKKLFVVSLVTFGLAGGSAQAAFSWNVTCSKFSWLKVRPVNCAHVMTPGETWTIPRPAQVSEAYTMNGKLIKRTDISTGNPSVFGLGLHHEYGKVYTGSKASWIKAKRRIVVVGLAPKQIRQ